MNVAVVVGPEGGLNLAPALRSVKAALLYADHVRLYDVSAYLLITAKRSVEQGNLAQIDLMADLLEQFGGTEIAGEVRKISPMMSTLLDHRGPLPPHLIAMKGKFAQLMRMMKRAYREGFATFDSVSFPELEKAVSSGQLSVHNFGEDSTPDALLLAYLRAISEVANANKAFPMFDSKSADLLHDGADMGIVEPPAGGKVQRRHAALAVELMDRLPVIDASVSTILAVRKDLRRHLDKFREAMISFTADVESEPWDKDFSRDAEMVYLQKVGPAVQEIEEAVRFSKPLQKLVGAAANPLPALGGSVLGVGISQLSHVASATAGIVGGATVTAIRTLGEVVADRERIEANKLYFYYKAKERGA